MNKQINLIYIVGGGHSGSTLLEMIIGSSKETFGLGEFSFFNNKLKGQFHYKSVSQTCTCEAPYKDCKFWFDVNKTLNFSKINIIKKYNLRENISFLFNVFFPFRNFKNIKLRKSNDYEIFQIIKKKSGTKYLIDSSKDPRRMIHLMKNKDINVIPIYLVRDGRAYANSYNRKKRTTLGLKRKNFYVCIFEWILLNLFTLIAIKKSKKKYLHISYDLFSKNPEKYIKKINNFLDINVPKNYIAEINKKNNFHMIAGNQMRFEKISGIKYDNKWKKEQRFLNTLIGTLLTSIFNKRWVYNEN